MIDEDRLRTLLGDAADTYPVPDGAVEQIVSTASGDARPGGVVRAIVPQGRWSRAALVGAAAVIVAGSVAVIGGSPGTGQNKRTAAAPTSAARLQRLWGTMARTTPPGRASPDAADTICSTAPSGTG